MENINLKLFLMYFFNFYYVIKICIMHGRVFVMLGLQGSFSILQRTPNTLMIDRLLI